MPQLAYSFIMLDHNLSETQSSISDILCFVNTVSIELLIAGPWFLLAETFLESPGNKLQDLYSI